MVATERKLSGAFCGEARLFKMEPPLEKHKYVVVSAVVAEFSGPETYIFPANKKGEIKDWGELEGSQRGTLSHEDVLSDLGYAIAK